MKWHGNAATVVVRCSQLTRKVGTPYIFEGNAEYPKESDLHTDFFPFLLTKETMPTKNQVLLYLKQETATQSSGKAHQATRSLKLCPRCIASCCIPGTATQDLPHLLSYREWHLSQNGWAAYLLKQGAGDAPTTESLQKSKEGKPWRGEAMRH